MPPSEATSQYPPVLGAMAIPTMGALRRMLPVEPQKGAPPKEKTPPSEAAVSYPVPAAAGTEQAGIDPRAGVPPASPVSWGSWWNMGQALPPTASAPLFPGSS